MISVLASSVVDRGFDVMISVLASRHWRRAH
jgi:hypothetical protein